MTDDAGTERAAQEYLAGKLSQQHQQAEDELNRQAAAALALIWKQASNTVYANAVAAAAVTGL